MMKKYIYSQPLQLHQQGLNNYDPRDAMFKRSFLRHESIVKNARIVEAHTSSIQDIILN